MMAGWVTPIKSGAGARQRHRPTHYMTMAMDPDLDQCVVRALRDMIALIGETRNLSREDACTLCSLAAVWA